MKVYDLNDTQGRVFAFEVDNTLLGRRGLCGIVLTIPGVVLVREPLVTLSELREEEFCEFEVDGVRFVAWEPFGDNSRYWIGSKPPRWAPQIETVREVFQRAKQFSIQRLFSNFSS